MAQFRTDLTIVSDFSSGYYIRTMAKDRPGVLGSVAGIFAKHGVSIESCVQKGRGEAAVPLIFVTHKAFDSEITAALKEIEALEEVILLSEFYLKKPGQEQARQVAELDGKFHKILYEASNSRILEHVLSDFHKYVKMARTLSVEEQDRAVKSVEEHREILEAIRNKDAGRAEALADRHIRKAMENLRNKQEEESEWQKSK